VPINAEIAPAPGCQERIAGSNPIVGTREGIGVGLARQCISYQSGMRYKEITRVRLCAASVIVFRAAPL